MKATENAMTPSERRASLGLAGIYALRMLGLFIILPIFAIYARGLPGGTSHTLIGMALGIYGLTQALLQIPVGWASDRFGRKPMIYLGLVVFAIGSFVAAYAPNIYWIIAGRAIQGAGAINAAVMALTADLTREEHRTKAMAMIGTTIGMTFSVSLILSPLLYHLMGVPGIFALTGVLSLLGIGIVAFVIPKPAITRFHSDTEATFKKVGEVLRNADLLRLNFGIFTLHTILMSVFMHVPFVLEHDGFKAEHHWMMYLPVMLVSFFLMVPPIIIAEKKAKMKQVFMGAVGLAALAQLALLIWHGSVWEVALALLLFFAAFNVLEATLPSLISKIAPLSSKGTAMGVYSSFQFLGAPFGATMGGILMDVYGGNAVFVFAVAMLLLWLLVAATMRPPGAVRTRLFHLPETGEAQAGQLQQKLAQVAGVREAMVAAAENMVCLKVEMKGFDEAAVEQLLKGA